MQSKRVTRFTHCALATWELNVANRLHDRALAVALITDNDELWKRRNRSVNSESLEALNNLNEGACLAAHGCHRVGDWLIGAGLIGPRSYETISIRLCTVIK